MDQAPQPGGAGGAPPDAGPARRDRERGRRSPPPGSAIARRWRPATSSPTRFPRADVITMGPSMIGRARGHEGRRATSAEVRKDPVGRWTLGATGVRGPHRRGDRSSSARSRSAAVSSPRRRARGASPRWMRGSKTRRPPASGRPRSARQAARRPGGDRDPRQRDGRSGRAGGETSSVHDGEDLLRGHQRAGVLAVREPGPAHRGEQHRLAAPAQPVATDRRGVRLGPARAHRASARPRSPHRVRGRSGDDSHRIAGSLGELEVQRGGAEGAPAEQLDLSGQRKGLRRRGAERSARAA